MYLVLIRFHRCSHSEILSRKKCVGMAEHHGHHDVGHQTDFYITMLKTYLIPLRHMTYLQLTLCNKITAA